MEQPTGKQRGVNRTLFRILFGIFTLERERESWVELGNAVCWKWLNDQYEYYSLNRQINVSHKARKQVQRWALKGSGGGYFGSTVSPPGLCFASPLRDLRIGRVAYSQSALPFGSILENLQPPKASAYANKGCNFCLPTMRFFAWSTIWIRSIRREIRLIFYRSIFASIFASIGSRTKHLSKVTNQFNSKRDNCEINVRLLKSL